MGGIDRTSGHIGTSAASSTSSTLKAAGGAAFSAVATGGSIAASALGGPAAGYAVSAGMSALRSGVSGSATSTGAGEAADIARESTADAKAGTNDALSSQRSEQKELMQLQMAMNSTSQAFNTLTNVQKSKHDAAMAAIQNTR